MDVREGLMTMWIPYGSKFPGAPRFRLQDWSFRLVWWDGMRFWGLYRAGKRTERDRCFIGDEVAMTHGINGNQAEEAKRWAEGIIRGLET